MSLCISICMKFVNQPLPFQSFPSVIICANLFRLHSYSFILGMLLFDLCIDLIYPGLTTQLSLQFPFADAACYIQSMLAFFMYRTVWVADLSTEASFRLCWLTFCTLLLLGTKAALASMEPVTQFVDIPQTETVGSCCSDLLLILILIINSSDDLSWECAICRCVS